MAERLRNGVRSPHPETAAVPVPHGPVTNPDATNLPSPDEFDDAEEEQVLAAVLKPPDSYDGSTPDGGVYWADLPRWKRFRWVDCQFWRETGDELRSLFGMRSILAPLRLYFHHSVLPGAGLGLEGYILFSIGNLAPLFAARYPECWDKHGSHAICAKNTVTSVTYLEMVGIMVGQIGVGIIGDKIGRRWGLVQDALIMGVGLTLLTASWGVNLQGWVICYAVALFVYGLGVGGEYPMTATSSMENAVGAGRVSTREDRMHRGRKVTLAFLMQGIGQFVNQLMLLFLLWCSNSWNLDPPYSEAAAQVPFRVSVGIIIFPTFGLAWYRFYHMKGASCQLEASKKASSRGLPGQSVTGYSFDTIRLCGQHLGGRLIATAGTWFCNDVFFYGNKLFQWTFISVIAGIGDDTSQGVALIWKWNLVNIVVSLVGYYAAAFFIDHKSYGRKRMQAVGFLACFLLGVFPAYQFERFTSPGLINVFMAMYFLSSFFTQFGPNSVTFLVAGEVFPASVRASAHGFSAFSGKAGALLTSIVFPLVSTQTSLKIGCWGALAGFILNLVFMPDTTGVDTKELERRWRYIQEGRGHEYRGIAVHPHHLSLWERWGWKSLRGQYDAGKDYKQRRRELREEWDRNEAVKYGIVIDGKEAEVSDSLDEDFPPMVHDYFMRTRSLHSGSPRMMAQGSQPTGQHEKVEGGQTGGQEDGRNELGDESEKQPSTSQRSNESVTPEQQTPIAEAHGEEEKRV